MTNMLSYVSDEALPALKKEFAAYHPEYRVNINSFTLFAAETSEKPEMWELIRIFRFPKIE